MEASMVSSSSLVSSPVRAETAASATSGSLDFLTTVEAAAFLRLSPRTLEKQRVLGGGPQFRKFGARVLYAASDLRSWADSRAYGMTSDPGYVQRTSVR